MKKKGGVSSLYSVEKIGKKKAEGPAVQGQHKPKITGVRTDLSFP